MMNSKLSSKPSMAVFQIAVLILGTFAFAYLFGGTVPFVEAQSVGDSCTSQQNSESEYRCSDNGNYVLACQTDITEDRDIEYKWGISESCVDKDQVCAPGSAVCVEPENSEDKTNQKSSDGPNECDPHKTGSCPIGQKCVKDGKIYQCVQSCTPGMGDCPEGKKCIEGPEGGGRCGPGSLESVDSLEQNVQSPKIPDIEKRQRKDTQGKCGGCGLAETCRAMKGKQGQMIYRCVTSAEGLEKMDTKNPPSTSRSKEKSSGPDLASTIGTASSAVSTISSITGSGGSGSAGASGGSLSSTSWTYGGGTGPFDTAPTTGTSSSSGFFGNVGSAFAGQGPFQTVSIGSGSGSISAGSYIFASAAAAIGASKLYVLGANLLGAGQRNIRSLKGASNVVGAAGVAYGGLSAASQAAAASGTTNFLTGTALSGAIPAIGATGIGLIAVGLMGVYTLTSYQLYSQHTYSYEVSSWQPEFGGEKCTECNDLRYGCSEYQCHTYGRACELVNKGTGHERCIWEGKDDQEPPIMEPMSSSLGTNQEYTPMENTQVPDDRGVQITNPSHPDGCLSAFSGAEIGVKTNELAECKVDINRRESYENMTSYFSQGTSLVKNHTLSIPGAAMPSDSAGEASGLQVENGEMNKYYAQCKDVNGNPSPNNMVIGFCVEEGPDTQPPVIEGTNYLNESFISNNQTTVPLEVYTNEPATCRWSRTNLGYSQMENNLSQCSQSMQDYLVDSSFQYGCSGNVTGVKSGQANDYYIKCKDKPWLEGNQSTSDEKRIENKESFELTLEGTEPLVIRNVTVNGRPNGTTIKDSTDSIRANLKVEIAAGAQSGNATCSYSIDGGTFNFYNNGTTGFVGTNTQELYLSEGNYNIPIQCNDAGGNVAESTVSFTIDQDSLPPGVTRTFHDNENLRVLTSEPSVCVYNTDPSLGCTYNYKDGLNMERGNNVTHYAGWKSNKRYYVKCADEFGNQPAPDQCSVTVRAYDL